MSTITPISGTTTTPNVFSDGGANVLALIDWLRATSSKQKTDALSQYAETMGGKLDRLTVMRNLEDNLSSITPGASGTQVALGTNLSSSRSVADAAQSLGYLPNTQQGTLISSKTYNGQGVEIGSSAAHLADANELATAEAASYLTSNGDTETRYSNDPKTANLTIYSLTSVITADSTAVTNLKTQLPIDEQALQGSIADDMLRVQALTGNVLGSLQTDDKLQAGARKSLAASKDLTLDTQRQNSNQVELIQQQDLQRTVQNDDVLRKRGG